MAENKTLKDLKINELVWTVYEASAKMSSRKVQEISKERVSLGYDKFDICYNDDKNKSVFKKESMFYFFNQKDAIKKVVENLHSLIGQSVEEVEKQQANIKEYLKQINEY